MDKTKKIYHDDAIDISFYIGDYKVSLLYISYEPPRYPWDIEMHSHNLYEIHFIPQGTGTLSSPDKDYAICGNTFYITGPDIMHKQSSTNENPMSEYAIQLDFVCVGKQSRTLDHSNHMNRLINTLCSNKLYFGDDNFGGTDLCKEMLKEIEHSFVGCQTKIYALLIQLIIGMARNMTQNNTIDGEPFYKRDLSSNRKKSLDLFFRSYRENITIEMAAKRLFVTRRQISRIMQDYYGMTFTQKLNRLRVDYAKERLTRTNIPIEKIALNAGYKTKLLFCQAFKKIEGCTPESYRKKGL